MTVKRSREEAPAAETVEETAAINLLMLLSRVGEATTSAAADQAATPSGRVFECKTCNKKFPTFQALGGHRASHKKLKLMAELLTQPSNSPRKPKKHECPFCGLEFPLGQALGGHMRRHRAAMLEGRREIDESHGRKVAVPVLKRSNSSKRVFGLDLNLSPFENDLRQLMKAPLR
nr:zinc finger protein ZAT8-like [Coffea arabica]